MKPRDLEWKQYLIAGTGRRLSLWGERLNIDWLIYNPIHFRHFHTLAMDCAAPVASTILANLPSVRSILDVGAGSGAFTAEFMRRGLRGVACERSPTGRKFARRQGVDCRPFDLSREQPAEVQGNFDLAICFEVAEHLPATMGTRLIKFIAAHASNVVFTAAHPGQGGTGHINEQPKSYWIDAFHGQGFTYQQGLTAALEAGFTEAKVPAPWFAQNVLAFTKS